MTILHLTNAAFKPNSQHATYSKQPITNAVLTCIFQMILGSSQTGGLNWLNVKDFTTFSSICKATHINSQRVWKNLLIHHNYGCLKTDALTQINPETYKVIFLQLTKLQISFETPRLVHKAGERGCKELMALFVANGNKLLPEKILFVNTLPHPSDTQAFVAAVTQDIDKFKKGDKDRGMTSPLLQAIHAKDTDLVHAMLIYDRAHVDAPKYMNPFALTKAVQEGQLEIVRLLLESDADVEKPDSHGMTLLMVAANKGELEIVRLLIRNNANINAVDHNGWDACKYARSQESLFFELKQEFFLGQHYTPLDRQRQIVEELLKRSSELAQIEKIAKKHKKRKI